MQIQPPEAIEESCGQRLKHVGQVERHCAGVLGASVGLALMLHVCDPVGTGLIPTILTLRAREVWGAWLGLPSGKRCHTSFSFAPSVSFGRLLAASSK